MKLSLLVRECETAVASDLTHMNCTLKVHSHFNGLLLSLEMFHSCQSQNFAFAFWLRHHKG